VRVNSIPERTTITVTHGRTNECVGHFLIVEIVRGIGDSLQAKKSWQLSTMDHFIDRESNRRIVVWVISRKGLVHSIVRRRRRNGISSHGGHPNDGVAGPDQLAYPGYGPSAWILIGRGGNRTRGARWNRGAHRMQLEQRRRDDEHGHSNEIHQFEWLAAD
jgi:hypothetical protein